MNAPATLPATMRVLRAHERGGPAVLAVEEAPLPRPGDDELLVAVHAAAITFDELRWDETWSHLPTTPSHEWSGVVAALGGAAASSGFAVGDAVYGMVPFDRDGAAAEYVVVPSALVAPKPVSLTHVEAAALPLAGLTARQALVDHGEVGPKDDVLVLGAAGGVGAFAVQLALRLGARVTATTFAKDVDYVTKLGAHVVHPADRPNREPLRAGSFDVVLDTVGGSSMHDAIALARPGGTYITLQQPAPADRLTELGVNGRFFVVAPGRHDLSQLGAEVDSGQVRVTVAATYPLNEGRAAFESGDRPGRSPGKTVLVVRDPSPAEEPDSTRMTSLTELAHQLLTHATTAPSGRSSQTVYGGHEHRLRQTLITLAAGQRLADHLSPGEATLQVLSGRVVLHVGDESWGASAGDLLILPGDRHSLAAVDDSAVLLTVSTSGPT